MTTSNPSAELREVLEAAGRRLDEEYVTTCHTDTCSGYRAVVIDPEPEVIAASWLPRKSGGRWSLGYEDALWRLADGRIVAVRLWHGSPSTHRSVSLVFIDVGPAPTVPVEADVAAEVEYLRGEWEHADSCLYDGCWHCGTGECGGLPEPVAWSAALYAAAAAADPARGAYRYRAEVSAAANDVLAPEYEAWWREREAALLDENF